MKYFIVFALFALVAAKPTSRLSQAEIDEIVAAINSPSTHPATAAALEQMLDIVLGIAESEPIHVGPEIVDFPPIQDRPEVVEVDTYEPIHVGPEIVDFPEAESVVAPTPKSSPLVQIIVNVKKPEDFPATTPVVVEGIDKPEPVPTPVNVVDEAFESEPVQVADSLPAPPEPVIVVDEVSGIIEPIIVAPGISPPMIVAPEILDSTQFQIPGL